MVTYWISRIPNPSEKNDIKNLLELPEVSMESIEDTPESSENESEH